ncbi:DUF6460 domain-containing protein [uncultured Rhodoblastus sp.]|uniref:DUF6460 domain-containing protein n=1 Tax=uncultured Rhodoblastus sp. TaxID=543037 RepID=UPI0025CE877E|nr:DUF6460 domain-containing protein [uncultured Rhodoblastus sp.]
MSQDTPPSRHPFEPREADLAAGRQPAPSELENFLGGSPTAVLVRLLIVSLIVGFFLVWLDIRPVDVLFGLRNIVRRFWDAGFDAIRDIAEYVLAGAAIVVPLWVALRLLNMRSRK